MTSCCSLIKSCLILLSIFPASLSALFFLVLFLLLRIGFAPFRSSSLCSSHPVTVCHGVVARGAQESSLAHAVGQPGDAAQRHAGQQQRRCPGGRRCCAWPQRFQRRAAAQAHAAVGHVRLVRRHLARPRFMKIRNKSSKKEKRKEMATSGFFFFFF